MYPFNFYDVLFPAITIFIVCFVATIYFTKNPVFSIIFSAAKALLFFYYFVVFFDGSYTFLDDIKYIENGVELFSFDFINEFYSSIEYAYEISDGKHFFYAIYNAFSFFIFGVFYFSPIAINVILSVLIAYLCATLVTKEFNLRKVESILFYFLLLLHPDIVSWSTVMNGKDILVLLLHIFILYSFSLYFREDKIKALLLFTVSSFILNYTRYYVPLIFGASYCVFLYLNQRAKVKIVLALIVLITTASIMSIISNAFNYELKVISDNFLTPSFGIVKFLLTPIPFNTESSYDFLTISALFNWILFPFSIMGFYWIYQFKTPFAKFLLIYFSLFVCLYAVTGELQGPRHRVQLDFAIACFQFFGVTHAFKRWRNKPMFKRVPQGL